jgi:hypothetical protein
MLLNPIVLQDYLELRSRFFGMTVRSPDNILLINRSITKITAVITKLRRWRRQDGQDASLCYRKKVN